MTDSRNGRNLQAKETSVVCQGSRGVSRLTLSRGQRSYDSERGGVGQALKIIRLLTCSTQYGGKRAILGGPSRMVALNPDPESVFCSPGTIIPVTGLFTLSPRLVQNVRQLYYVKLGSGLLAFSEQRWASSARSASRSNGMMYSSIP